MIRLLLPLFFMISLSACALDPYNLNGTEQIAGIGPKTPTFLKSLRCEMITFLVQNRLRAALWEKHIPLLRTQLERHEEAYNTHLAYLKRFPYIDIDATQFAAVQADLKTIDMLTASLGADLNYIAVPAKDASTYHFGPSIAQTRTFETVEPMALPQYADFGPLKSFNPDNTGIPKAVIYTKLYNFYSTDDDAFHCYKSFYDFKSSNDLEHAIFDTQMLLTNDEAIRRDYVKFKRIYVDGLPMAEWLMNKAVAMSEGYQTVHATYESLIPGQLEYTFTLDIKPGLDLKYTAISYKLNPLNIEGNGSLEHSANFAMYFNTKYSLPALTAKNGNTCIGKLVSGRCVVKRLMPNLLPTRLESLQADADVKRQSARSMAR